MLKSAYKSKEADKLKAFEILCRENYARIYNYIYAMTKDAFLSEDLVQDVFLIAYRKGEAFLQHEKPEAFLYRTAKNKVLEAMRQNQMLELKEDLAAGEGDLLETILSRIDSRECVQNWKCQKISLKRSIIEMNRKS